MARKNIKTKAIASDSAEEITLTKSQAPAQAEGDGNDEMGEQIPLEEEHIFNMAIILRKAIKEESAANKDAFYNQTIATGGVMSKLRSLRKNPGISKSRMEEFDSLIAEIKDLIELKLDGYKPASDKKATIQGTNEKKPAQEANKQHVATAPSLAMAEEQNLKDFIQKVEKVLVDHTARLPMTKQACIDFIKKSGRQYIVAIAPSSQNPDMHIVTVSIGSLKEDLVPLKLYA